LNSVYLFCRLQHAADLVAQEPRRIVVRGHVIFIEQSSVHRLSVIIQIAQAEEICQTFLIVFVRKIKSALPLADRLGADAEFLCKLCLCPALFLTCKSYFFSYGHFVFSSVASFLYSKYRINDSFPGRGLHHGVSKVFHFLSVPALFTGVHDEVGLNQDLIIQTVNRVERVVMTDKP